VAEQQGPPMIVATEALSSPKVRVGHIGGNFTLPRTIPLTSLIAGAVGAFVGLLLAVVVVPGLEPMLFCAVLGGLGGVAVVTWSPLKGESLSRWLGLRFRQGRQRIHVESDVVQVAVGVALLKSATLGTVRIVPGAVNVPPSQYDERGAPIDPDDALRQMLEAQGLAEMAETVLSGALSLDDVDAAPAPPPFRRHRTRPSASIPSSPRTARPLFSSPLAPAPSTLLSQVKSPSDVSSLPTLPMFSAPSVTAPKVVPIEVAPDLPDLAGLGDWLPAASLDSIFESPTEEEQQLVAVATDTAFGARPSKVEASGWVTVPTKEDALPSGWTKPTS
jgi:hypothetical protein